MKLKGSKVLNVDEIQALIGRGLNYVYFSAALEPIYRQQYREEAAYEFRYRGPFIFFLYIFLSLGIYQTLPNQDIFLQWLSFYTWVGVIIFTAWVMSFFPRFNQYFDYYAGFGCMMAVAITFIIITNISSNVENTLIHTSMMYAVIIIYGFVGLRFYTALIAGWMGGLIGVILSLLNNLDIGWTVLHRTYTFSSFLGMAFAYAIDRQHRENYLQNCVIELNKSELLEQAKQLEQLSQQDALTGLANRRHLNHVLDRQWRYALRHQEYLSILMVDIDCFKDYNDQLGHLEGDICLQLVARELKKMTMRSDDLAARYGGEEFMLVFTNTNAEQAELMANKLIHRIQDLAIPHPKSMVGPYVTVSIGVATIIPQYEQNLEDIIAMADHALYKAKTQGRNQYHLAHRHVA